MQYQNDPVNDETCAKYKLLAPCQLDDTLYDEGTIIYFTGWPNEEMEPLNDLAREASRKNAEMLDDAARSVAAARDRPFNGRPTDAVGALSQMIDDAHAAERKVVLPVSRDDVPMRPDLATPAQKARMLRQKPNRVLGAKAAPKPVTKGGAGNPVVLGPQLPSHE